MNLGLMMAGQAIQQLNDVCASRDGLRRRIDRTLDYTDSLMRLPDLNPQLGEVLRAIHNSLCTPATQGATNALSARRRP